MNAFRTRPSPVLVLGLAGLWLLLNQSVSPGHLLLAVVFATVLAWIASSLRPLRARMRRFDAALLLLLVVLGDIVQSNVKVARIVLGLTGRRRGHAAFIRIPLELRDPHGLAALSAIVTATPGTVWAGLSASGDVLTLHVLDLQDETALISTIKRRYERPLIRVFE